MGFIHVFTYKKGPGADSYEMALRDNRITQRPLNFFQGMNTSLTKKNNTLICFDREGVKVSFIHQNAFCFVVKHV